MSIVRRQNRHRMFLLSLVIVLFLFLSFEILWNFVISPRLLVRKVMLESDLSLSDEQVLEMIDINGETWTSIDESSVEKRLESYPVVRKARVVKVFPDTIKLYIYRRRPLVVALLNEDGVLRPVIFDEEGYLVQLGAGHGNLDLPVILTSDLPDVSLGSRLPEFMLSLLGDLSAIRSEDSHLFALISEVEVVPHGNANYDLKLYMNHIPISILVDHKLTVESVRQAVLVLDVLASSQKGAIKEADMRGGHVVYRPVEEG